MSEGQHRNFLNGRYQHNVDKAGRVSVPARWCRSEGDQAQSFMVVCWPLDAPKCLKVLPPDMYERILESLGAGQLTNDEEAKFLRAVGANSEIQELDDSGRLVLRPDLCESVGIKGTALLVGCVRYFEVWNEQKFQAELPETLQAAASSAKQKGI
jgi:division/cell wall cluster transcriptional repressor MraZ